MPFRRLLWVVGVLGCAGSPPKAPPNEPKPAASVLATSPPPSAAEPPLTELATGALVPVRAKAPVELELQARASGPEIETLKLSFAYPGTIIRPGDVVDVTGAVTAFIANGQGTNSTLWVRRPISKATEPVTGDIYSPASEKPGIRYSLRQKPGTVLPSTPALEGELFEVLARTMRVDLGTGGTFDAFMARRLNDMTPAKRRVGRQTAPRLFIDESELRTLMDTTTGRSAIQRAIQNENDLVVRVQREPRKLPLSSAPPPALPRADYSAMLAALGATPPPEPLAKAAPADFWYVRARTFTAFLDFLDLASDFGQPTADILGGDSEDRGTTARYMAELALERTELSRVLGPSVIESVAIVGSDPYVHDGTDLTLLFKVSAPPLFEAALAKALSGHAQTHGGVKTSAITHEGVTIRAARSADGRVRQYRANVAGLELVSNSPAAIRRVIGAALGKSPRLADEPDFRFLTARDAGTPDDVMAFLSDRFVLAAIGPAQKIAQARRQFALAELSTPGFAALLYGYLNGKSPKDDKELVKGGELLASELKHADGAPITWQPGKPASSRWGTTKDLEPLVDLPPVERISEAEQHAYASFASEYSALWSEYVDPIIVRMARSKETPGRYDIALRALPLLRADNRELMQMVGSARVEVPPQESGLRWVLALGKDAALRHELEGQTRFAGHSMKFDWLGDSVRVGLANRSELTRVARAFVKDKLEVPAPHSERGDELEAVAELPLYAAIEVKNRVGAVVALGTLRKMAEDLGRDMLEWRDGGKHRDVSITDVSILPSGFIRKGAHLYYALCPKALIFALNQEVLKSVIDEELDGKAPRGAGNPAGPGAAQLVIELGAKKDGALLRTIGWLAATELVTRHESRNTAEAILRGAPESRANGDAFRALARATFGHVPLTPDGALYQYTVEGIRDPARGTDHAPVFPKVPTPGSPLASVLSRFVRLRSNVSFDPEPGSGPRNADTRSFSARLSLELR